jgi:hypothetical protein
MEVLILLMHNDVDFVCREGLSGRGNAGIIHAGPRVCVRGWPTNKHKVRFLDEIVKVLPPEPLEFCPTRGF